MDLPDVVGRIAGKMAIFVWRVLPWMVQVAWDLCREIYEMQLAMFRSWPTIAKRKAREWTRKVMADGIITSDHSEAVWWIFYILGYATLAAGWAIPPFVVLWILRRLLY